MKVYVITNQALYHDSSYYAVVTVEKSMEDARVVLGTLEADFIKGVEAGYFSQDFLGFENLDITEGDLELRIEDKTTGMFESWSITECELAE